MFISISSFLSAKQKKEPPGDSKLFELECWDVLSRITDTDLQGTRPGGCTEDPPDKRDRACPDIVGSCRYGSGKPRCGFVADCKLYGEGLPITSNDVKKLREDISAKQLELEGEDLIPKNGTITGIFITTTSNTSHVGSGFQVIKVNYKGGLGDKWEDHLKQQFKKIMNLV